MKVNSYSVCIISGEGDPLAAESLPLVAALLALGVPALPKCPFYETVEEISGEEDLRRLHKWFLSDKSPCGKYHAGELMRHWDDRIWLFDNQRHPLAMIRFAFHFADISVSPFQGNAGNFKGWLDKSFRDKYRAGDDRAFIGDAFAVLDLLRLELANSVPLLIVKKGGKRVMIPIDATAEEEAELLSKLEK